MRPESAAASQFMVEIARCADAICGEAECADEHCSRGVDGPFISFYFFFDQSAYMEKGKIGGC